MCWSSISALCILFFTFFLNCHMLFVRKQCAQDVQSGPQRVMWEGLAKEKALLQKFSVCTQFSGQLCSLKSSPLLETNDVRSSLTYWLRMSLLTGLWNMGTCGLQAGESRSGAPLALGAHGLHKQQDKHHCQEGCGTHDCGCGLLQLHLTATSSCLSTW